jgi:hypothetical protein
MKEKYEAPEIRGPIECMRGTISFGWNKTSDKIPKMLFSMPERPAKLSIRMREEEFGCVVYNPITDALYECNKSAASMMAHLDGKHTVDELADMLTRDFDVEFSVVKKDIEDYIEKNIYKLE